MVAMQVSLVEKYLRGFERLHLTCVHMDVLPWGGDAIEQSVQGSESRWGRWHCRTYWVFAIAERGKILFWRPFELSGTAHTEEAALAGIQTNLNRIGDEISKCISHMVGTMHLESLGEMLLYGHGSNDLVVTST